MKGGSYSVLWTSMRDDIALCSSVEIALMRGTRRVDTVTTENDGAHLFYVRSAVEDSDDYRLHLQCVQPRSLSAALQGTSDRFVVESNPATFDVSSPAKGAVWPLASDNVVSWSLARSVRGSTACDRVQLLLIRRAEASSSHPDEPISLVTVTPAETGTDYAFHVPARTPPGTYLMRVQCAGDTALGGESEPFRISLNPGALVVTQPRQGQRCLLGHECPLAWTSTLIGHTSTCAQLEGALLDDGRTVGEFRAPIGAKALGRYLPASLAPGSRYTYELRCANDSAVRAASKYFKVEADAEALELSSPQPGEFWSSGLAHEVRWESSVSASPNCSTVSIDLVAGPAPSAASRPPSRSRGRGGRGSERAPPRQPTRVLASWPHAPNSGSHEVYVPGSTPAGEGYEIRLVCDGDQALRVSSAPFTIQPDSGALSFTSPSEGAEWTAGSVQFVQWEASDGLRSAASCAHVDVLVRHDGHTLSSARAPNDGRYSLYINGSLAPGPGYQLVLRCAADSGVSAQSPYFSVAALPRAFALTTPSAASEWVPGQSYAVRWSSPLQLSDVCDTVRAELLAGPTASARRGRRQRDAARDSLVAAVEASNTGRAWLTLPRSLDAGDEYRVRLSCVRDPALNSTSAAFSVRAPCAGAGCHDDDTRRAAVGAAPSPSRGALGGAPSAPTQPVTPWGSVRTTPGVSPLPFSSRTDARAPPPPPPGSLTRGGSGGSGSSSRLSGGLPLVGMEEEADAAEGGGVRSADDPDGLCDAGGHVAAGMSHSCAVTSTGGLLCWGDNTEGQTEVPAEVDGWLQVSAGVTHTCAVTAERTLRCWGGRHRWTPVAHHEAAVPSGELWHHVSAGHAFSCAVSLSHRLACWGYDGEMGGDRPPRGLLWTSVSVGEAHACGITTEGAAVCWGDNSNGQSNVPFRARWAQVSTHHRHTCGVTADAELVCWGSAEHGQLDAPEGYEWSAVSVGHSHSCGLTKERLLRCWGHLTFGLGNAPPGYRWAEISVGMYHACGLVESDGDVLCWGMDYHSQAQVPQGYKYWVGCDGPAPLGARGVESEHKPGKFVCPQHETLHAGTAYESRWGTRAARRGEARATRARAHGSGRTARGAPALTPRRPSPPPCAGTRSSASAASSTARRTCGRAAAARRPDACGSASTTTTTARPTARSGRTGR